VLKNGREVEKLQLAAVDRVERALALFMAVAWRVAYLMRKDRDCPDLDAALFFDADEIRGARNWYLWPLRHSTRRQRLY
jgi:hypothetical protein